MAFTRQSYERCAYDDQVRQSVSPLNYALDATQIKNCNECLSVHGPRNKIGSYAYRPSSLVDVDSLLSNRNDINTKCIETELKRYLRDDIITQNGNFNKYTEKVCQNNFLDAEDTRFTHPKNNYRGLAANRFYKLNKDPQCNIFWDFAQNTRLEARDNYIAEFPDILDDETQPTEEVSGTIKSCGIKCSDTFTGNVPNVTYYNPAELPKKQISEVNKRRLEKNNEDIINYPYYGIDTTNIQQVKQVNNNMHLFKQKQRSINQSNKNSPSYPIFSLPPSNKSISNRNMQPYPLRFGPNNPMPISIPDKFVPK